MPDCLSPRFPAWRFTAGLNLPSRLKPTGHKLKKMKSGRTSRLPCGPSAKPVPKAVVTGPASPRPDGGTKNSYRHAPNHIWRRSPLGRAQYRPASALAAKNRRPPGNGEAFDIEGRLFQNMRAQRAVSRSVGDGCHRRENLPGAEVRELGSADRVPWDSNS